MSVKNKIILSVALITILAQIGTPLSMINRYETILEQGVEYRFIVEPVDPADPFKGRYVRLTFPIARGKYSELEQPLNSKDFKRKDVVYLVLGKSADDTAIITALNKQKPDQGDYVKAKLRSSSKDRYFLKLPFERFYAEESKAPKIESLVWNNAGEQMQVVTAAIRIKEGEGVIQELYIGEVPVLDYIKE